MSELPKGWAICSLADIGQIVTGKTPSTKEPRFYGGNTPFIKPGDLDHSGLIFQTESSLTDAGAAEVPSLPPQSIVVTCIGNLGKVGLTTTTSATNQQINAVLPEEGVNPSFLFHYCKTLKPWLESESSATTISIVNKGIFSTAPVPLAPLAEQTRIAQKLDELLTQVDTLKARIDAIPALLKRFRQSVLAAAVSGRLTDEWRKQSSFSDEVPETLRLSEIASEIVDCPHSTPKWQPYGKKCVRTTEFRPGLLDVHAAGFVSEETYAERTKRIKPAGGDILYAREGTVGIACPVPHDVDLCMGQRMVLIRAGTRVHPTYLLHVLNSELVLSKVRSLVMGSTAPRVNVKDLKNFEIPTPSLNEQTEIVRRVEQLFAFADQLEAKVASAKNRIDHLTQSILAKAFRGELVPQDPNDEPAIVLLERIQAQRASAPKVKRGRKASA